MNCILCNNSSLTLFSGDSYMKLPVYFCANCQLYITGNSHIEVKEKSEEIYKKSYWDENKSEESIRSNFTDVYSQDKRRQWVSQYAYCLPYLNNKKNFLEIGTGAGQTIFWFEDIGFQVTGIEPDERNVKLINGKLKRGHCVTGYAEDLNMEGQFDVIWISHVFEHLVRPDEFLKKCKTHLNPDGMIFIEIPNCENQIILKSSIHDNPSTFHFTRNGLLKLAQNCGFNVQRCDFFRSPTLFEGALNKITKRYFSSIKNPYQYYPKIISNNKDGTDIRLILK